MAANMWSGAALKPAYSRLYFHRLLQAAAMQRYLIYFFSYTLCYNEIMNVSRSEASYKKKCGKKMIEIIQGDRAECEDTDMAHPRGIGLALGGGVARGLAHIGVMKVLQRNNITPSIIAGTSIGAVVGGAYLAGKLDALEDWARGLTRMNILSYMDFRVRGSSMIGGTRLKKLLEENFKDIMIEDLPHPFIGLATDLGTGHEVWLRKGRLVDAMFASFALPGIFPPVQLNDRLLVDGALVNPVPVAPTLSLGARMTIAVDLNADMVGKATQADRNGYNNVMGFDLYRNEHMPKEMQKEMRPSLARKLFSREDNNPSLFGVMFSALGIMNDRITRSRLAGDPPDIHIKPNIGHIGMMEFEKGEELIAIGEEAAEKALPAIIDAMNVFLPHDKQK